MRPRKCARLDSPVSGSQCAWRRSSSTWPACSSNIDLTRPTIAFIARVTLRSSGMSGSSTVTKRRSVIALAWSTVRSSGTRMRLTPMVENTPANASRAASTPTVCKVLAHSSSSANADWLRTSSRPIWCQPSLTCATPSAGARPSSATNQPGAFCGCGSPCFSTSVLPLLPTSRMRS